MNNGTHALTRTSPKGGPFIGTCMKCGATDLTIEKMKEPCVNPGDLSEDEVLIMAIKGGNDA